MTNTNTNPTHLDLIIADLTDIYNDCINAAEAATDLSTRAYWQKEAKGWAARIARRTA